MTTSQEKIQEIREALARAKKVVTGEYIELSDGREIEAYRTKLRDEDAINAFEYLSSLLSELDAREKELELFDARGEHAEQQQLKIESLQQQLDAAKQEIEQLLGVQKLWKEVNPTVYEMFETISALKQENERLRNQRAFAIRANHEFARNGRRMRKHLKQAEEALRAITTVYDGSPVNVYQRMEDIARTALSLIRGEVKNPSLKGE